MEQGWWWWVAAQAVLLPGLAVLYFFFADFFNNNSGGKRSKARLPLPPGPRGLPWLGNLLQFTGPRRNKQLAEWTRRYGPVVTVRLGWVPFIFVSGRAEAKELLLAPGGLFDSRPRRPSRVDSSNDHRTINTSPYGPRWRELRRNLTVNVLGRARIAAMAPFRRAQVQAMVDRLKKHARDTPDVPVAVRDDVRFVGFTLLLYMTFGKVLEEEQVRAMDEAGAELFRAAGLNVADFVPCLGPLLNPGYKKRYWAARRKFEKVAAPLVTQIREARRSQQSDNGDECGQGSSYRCYMDTLVEEEAKGVVEPADYIVLCSELLNAGTDTSTGAMEFALAELVNRPKVQAKLAAEIDAVCGDRPLQEQDIESLPYLRAVASETLRRHPTASGTLSHQPMEEGATLCGYAIPRQAEVVVCIEQMCMDPEVWENPREFVPERFLEGPSRAAATGPGPADMRMIPFGAGRRICPGMDLGLLHLHLIVGRLVQEFEWLPPRDDGQLVDLSHLQEFTVRLKHPLQARIKLRRSI